ncbi:MAG: UDP-N-acetylmuramoyl-tripeptide--D-alanyl-D-alanine ligase [Campylobacteraceae bacterium]|nr:UDP-N-acetylmuramoyl-tripeptide--D-alanyl-D-alanine ligase [Campylobacteraceae bacterium]
MFVAFELFSHILFSLCLGYYMMTALQWYNYRIKRVILHFHKIYWHLLFFFIPVLVYYLAGVWAWVYIYFAFLPWLVVWARKLDKPLVLTARVKRFFAFLLFAILFQDFLCLASVNCVNFGLLMPLAASLIISSFYEKLIFHGFYSEANTKLENRSNLVIIAITASFGKTSIKHFLAHILSQKFTIYHTPGNVNTLTGLVQDVNKSLPENIEIYIAEAGAREQGDIAEIAKFLSPQVVIIGQVGSQHIEYFKTLEAIRNTKMELIHSKRLKHAFVHKSLNILPSNIVHEYGDELKRVEATLEGTTFEVFIDGRLESFKTDLLGEFNAQNILSCILVARALGMELETIKDAVKSLPFVAHRLSPMRVGGKLILDDSYNGNRSGMEASYRLAAKHLGRKILVTPGIIESNIEENEDLAKVMNEVFDIVIITGSTNAQTLLRGLKKPKIHLLKDKKGLEELLAKETHSGDLILFSNDAPNYL